MRSAQPSWGNGGGGRGRREALREATELAGPTPEQVMVAALDSISKARFFDPEHRRQRRLGMAEAALTGGAAAGLALGGRGVIRSTKTLRNVSGVTVRHPDKATAAQKAKRSKAAADALKGVTGSRRDLLLLGGGTAAGGGAVAVNRHAESRKGRGWN